MGLQVLLVLVVPLVLLVRNSDIRPSGEAKSCKGLCSWTARFDSKIWVKTLFFVTLSLVLNRGIKKRKPSHRATFSMGHGGARKKFPNEAPRETLSLRLSRPTSTPLLTLNRPPACGVPASLLTAVLSWRYGVKKCVRQALDHILLGRPLSLRIVGQEGARKDLRGSNSQGLLGLISPQF